MNGNGRVRFYKCTHCGKKYEENFYSNDGAGDTVLYGSYGATTYGGGGYGGTSAEEGECDCADCEVCCGELCSRCGDCDCGDE